MHQQRQSLAACNGRFTTTGILLMALCHFEGQMYTSWLPSLDHKFPEALWTEVSSLGLFAKQMPQSPSI